MRSIFNIDPHETTIGEILQGSEANEIIHGLRGLNESFAFEKAMGHAAADARMACALSVSATHTGLKTVARDHLQEALAAAPDMPHLDVYVFSEAANKSILGS